MIVYSSNRLTFTFHEFRLKSYHSGSIVLGGQAQYQPREVMLAKVSLLIVAGKIQNFTEMIEN